MKKSIKILLVSCLALSGIVISHSLQAQSKKSKTAIIKTNIYCDHCLECDDCGGKLVHDLSFVKGIKQNSVDPKAMTITITYNPQKVSLEKIKSEISKRGYDADDVKADPAAYSKLDDCCKKQ